MDAIGDLIALARRRTRLTQAFRVGSVVCILLSSLVVLLSIFDRLPAASILAWWWIGIFFLCIACLATFWTWWTCRPSDQAMAAKIDERLGLEDRLSTALHVASRDDPVARAAVQDGIRVAQDPRMSEQLRRTWPVKAPEGWWASPLLVLLAIIIGFFGQADLFTGSQEDRPEFLEAGYVPNDGMEEIVASIEANPDLQKELSELLDEMEAEQALEQEQTPEQERREALKRMTEIERRLEELSSGETGQSMEAMRNALQQLDVPAEGRAQDLVEAMSKGDFSKAAEALRAMQDELASGEMNESDREAMAQDLEDLAKALEELAQDQEALKNALKQAGLDQQLASDPEAMRQAVEQASQLSEQQRQQLMDMIESQEATAQALKQMSKAAEQMCKDCKSGAAGGAGKKLSQQLSKMEQMKQMLKQAKATSKQCRSQCRSLGRSLGRQGMGAGQGNKPGQHGGGTMDVEETETDMMSEMASGTTTDGRVIGEQKFDGPLVTGESSASFDEILVRSREGFDDAFNEDRLPRKYHDLIKHYFGDADKVTEVIEYDTSRADEASADSASDEESDAPSEPSTEEEAPSEESDKDDAED